MPVKRITPQPEVDNYFDRYLQDLEKSIIRQFCYIGEKCLIIGRSTDSYLDQTGNLRNSIGYVVVCNGRVVQQATTEENRGTENGKRGSSEANDFMGELISQNSNNICLIVVAGMKYATYVSAKGFDVLDSAEIEAEKLMTQLGFVRR